MDKKGLSPIIATVLLISLVLILGIIIFLWARAFLPETLEKFEGPIEDSCASTVFVADASSDTLSVQNNGNVPIQGFEVGIKRGIGSLEYIKGGFSTGRPLIGGGTKNFDMSAATPSPQQGDELVVTPVLLGKTRAGDLKAFVCEEEYSVAIRVR